MIDFWNLAIDRHMRRSLESPFFVQSLLMQLSSLIKIYLRRAVLDFFIGIYINILGGIHVLNSSPPPPPYFFHIILYFLENLIFIAKLFLTLPLQFQQSYKCFATSWQSGCVCTYDYWVLLLPSNTSLEAWRESKMAFLWVRFFFFFFFLGLVSMVISSNYKI